MMKVSNKGVGILGLFVGSLLSTVAIAEDGAIAPDRPGLSTGTHTISPGVVYLEAGYQYEFTRTDIDVATHTFPQVVVRTGINDKLEIDFVWDGFNRDHVEGLPNETSRADLAIGGKYRLFESEDFNLTLLGLINAPVGSSPSTSNNIDPLLGLLWDYNLSGNLQLFGVIQSTRLEDENENDFQENQFGLGINIGHTEKLTSFVEYFANFPNQSLLDEQHIIDAGVTYLYTDDLQFDFSAGVGLNDETSHFVSLGVSVRF